MIKEKRFNLAMNGIYNEAKPIGYTANHFLKMLRQHGGVSTVKMLIDNTKVSSGYSILSEMRVMPKSSA